MKKENFKYTDEETELIRLGANLYERKLKTLLSREENISLTVVRRSKINEITDQVFFELNDLENEQK